MVSEQLAIRGGQSGYTDTVIIPGGVALGSLAAFLFAQYLDISIYFLDLI